MYGYGTPVLQQCNCLDLNGVGLDLRLCMWEENQAKYFEDLTLGPLKWMGLFQWEGNKELKKNNWRGCEWSTRELTSKGSWHLIPLGFEHPRLYPVLNASQSHLYSQFRVGFSKSSESLRKLKWDFQKSLGSCLHDITQKSLRLINQRCDVKVH